MKTAYAFVVGGDVFDDSQAHVTMCGSAKIDGEDGIFGLLFPSRASDFGAVQFAFFRGDATFEQRVTVGQKGSSSSEPVLQIVTPFQAR